MFNWSIKLREQNDFCVPQGPQFKQAKLINFVISGTKLSLLAPRHSGHFSSDQNIQPKKVNEYDLLLMKPCRDDEEWEYHIFLMRSWGFYGDWFSGYKGDLTLRVALINRVDTDNSVSLFRPKAFENSVADFLNNRYADDVYEGAQEWLAPVDWKVVKPWPCPAVTFYVRPNAGNPASPDRYFLFPISDKHFIEVYFNLQRGGAGSQEEKDTLISLSTIEQLSTDIINSIRLELSPEALAQQAKALKDCQDKTLSESFPPLKWTSAEQDAEYEKYLQEEQKIKNLS